VHISGDLADTLIAHNTFVVGAKWGVGIGGGEKALNCSLLNNIVVSSGRSLAQGVLGEDDAMGNALVAFYYLVEGDAASARIHVSRSGEYGELLSSLFMDGQRDEKD
jgi:hypothetical protein